MVSPGLVRDLLPNNLPIELSSFVGRQGEIAELCPLVIGNRLVTITGSGGAGKTRLAHHVAAQLQMNDLFRDGTWWVELAPVDASAVRRTIASVLSIVEPNRLIERLVGRVLIVLDNCEHVKDVVAPLVHEILSKCPDATLLATSRGSLDIPGEVTWRVPPLAAPQLGEPVTIESLGQFDAVRLFVHRATRVRPNFALTTENGPAVAEICARLGGIPLAIELAAARSKALTAEQILAGLDDALRFLTGGSRLVMPRQQTLETSIAWSHDLLDERDQILFRRLSVFAGGCDLSAAEALCSDGTRLAGMEVLDGLERLTDQSLLRVDETRGVARYQLLETVRQFGARRLTLEASERDETMRRHASWFARLAADIGPMAEGSDEEACVARLLPERDNLAAALRHIRATGASAELAEMVLACGPFWDAAELAVEGRTWTAIALEAIGDGHAHLRARLLGARVRHLLCMGDWFPVLGPAEAAVELADKIGDRRTAGRARPVLASRPMLGVDVAVARFDQAVAECRAVGDRFGEGMALLSKTHYFVMSGALRQGREALSAADQVVQPLANASQRAHLYTYRALLSIHTADHEGMQLAIETLRPEHATFSLATFADLMMRVDRGGELPEADELEARVHQFLRIEDNFAATTLVGTLLRLLHHRDEFARGRALADYMVQRLPVPSWNIEGARLSLALGDVRGARERLARATPADGARVAQVMSVNAVMALLARHDGDLPAAETCAHQTLSLAAEHGHVREIVDTLEMLAGLAAVQGSWPQAARLAGAAQHQRDSHPLKGRVEPLRSMLAADLIATRDALGDEAYETAFTEGSRLSIDQAVEYAQRGRGERARPTLGWAALSPTERRVADLARRAFTNAEIARELLMGAETVKTHLSRAYAKLGVANRAQLAALPSPSRSA